MPRAQFRDTVMVRKPNGLLSLPPLGSTAALYDVGTTALIAENVYADSGSPTTLSNPIAVSSDGLIDFWLLEERMLDVVTSCPGFADVRTTVTTDAAAASSVGPPGAAGATGPQGPPGPPGTSIVWLGAWSPSTTYVLNNAVSSGQSSYVCISPVTGGAGPASDPSHWSLMAAGMQGPPGNISTPLSQNLTFSPDNTYNIGAVGPNLRPHNVYLGNTLYWDVGANQTWMNGTLGVIEVYSPQPLGVMLDTGLCFGSDNTYDIGASTGNRPRNVWVASAVKLADGADIEWPYGGLSRIINIAGAGTYLDQGGGYWAFRNSNAGYANVAELTTQALRLYDTYTDSANYSRLSFRSSNPWWYIEAVAAGTGTIKNLVLSAATLYFQTTGANTRWIMDASGNFIANNDNTYDIGASGANRPRNVYLGGGLVVGQAGGTIPGSAALVVSTSSGGPWAINLHRTDVAADIYFFVSPASLGIHGGSLQWVTDNTYDIGASGANRPRNVYAAGSVTTPQLWIGSGDISDSRTNMIGNLILQGSVYLYGEAGNTLAQRNGTSPQTLRIYNTYTDASNNERLNLTWSGNAFYLFPSGAGTGAARAVHIQADAGLYLSGSSSVDHWRIASGVGHILAGTDNTYDIGASGASRPRNVYVGNNIYVAGQGVTGSGTTLNLGAGGGFFWNINGINGGIYANNDNAYDIGASGATRPRNVYAAGGHYLGNTTATQGGAIWGGSGVPAAALGANGDYYFRTDAPGAAATRIYVKSAGAWVATAA